MPERNKTEVEKEGKKETKANEVEEVKEIEKVPVVAPEEKVVEIPKVIEEVIPELKPESVLEKWIPKTSLGRKVFNGEITDIDEILRSGTKITESEIVDKLVPNIKNELILIGGRTGKGGGIERIPMRITAKMTKSGRRFTMGAFVVVGNEDGLVGIGSGKAPEARDAIAKATKKAKQNIMKVKRGCGSWECGCSTEHSIPFKIIGKSGSVRIELLPAPKGVGLVANNESKKVLRLAGIKDIWVKSSGNTGMRINLVSAILDALKKLYVYERSD